ncbi:MAG: hypothetical protein E2O60_01275 [Gammaproteobacteria bacterium]|nr:MAG: hypothetical protein E2O60_01275 [Gammaproteobacteria bacterium]
MGAPFFYPMNTSRMQTLLREPLLHFLLIGAVLFFVFGQVGDPVEVDNRIVVSQADLDILANDWLRRTGRPPSPQQVEQQLRQYIREQVLSREAVNLGLDRDDVIIRRRLAQKMQFLFDDLGQVPDPTEAELIAFMSQHVERFTLPGTLSFRHIFLDPDSRGEAIQEQAQQMLSRLQESSAAVDTSELGDQTLLPDQLGNETRQQVSNLFGDQFAERVYALPVNRWSGPVISGYGLHLVYVHARTAPRVQPLAEVRESVIRQWRTAKQQELNDLFYQGIQQRYEIILDDDISQELVMGTGQ